MKEIEELRSYIKKVKAQIEIVKKTEFKKTVLFKKVSWGKPVEYEVGLLCIPQIEGGKSMRYKASHYQIFVGGAKKKEAIAYAKALAKEEKAEIEFQN
jgi:hypothetical protein